MVDITSAAVAEIKRLQNQQTPDVFLRLTIKPGGCLDFFYDLAFEPQTPTNDGESAGDRLIEVDGICLAIDRQSWEYSENLKLDYAEDLMGGGFRFHNSQHQKTCGCGVSFVPASE